MSAPSTVVTLVDEDGDEFPIRLPGVYREHRAAEIKMAVEILNETNELRPNGNVTCASVEYLNEAS